MLFNEIHQGGIRALLEWDNTIFDNMSLPENIEAGDVIDRIIYKYGDTPLMTPDAAVLKYYVTRWSARRLPLWNKYKAAVEAEYNPIENYDRNEDITRTPNITRTQTGSITDQHTGTTSDAHTGTQTTASTGNTDTQRAADNSSTWENYDKNNVNLTDTTTNNLTDARTHNDTITKTYNNVKDQESGNERTISRIHGNIGVSTAMQMQNEYFDIIPRFDVIEYIVDDWHDEFCLLLY